MLDSKEPESGDDRPALDAFFKPAPSKAGALGRVRSFLNSPLGLAVAGFILTTGLGTFLTDYWHAADKARDDRAAGIQLQEDEMRALRTGVKQAIVEREVSSDIMIQALERKAAPAEISALWQQYMQAYRQELAAYNSNHLSLEGIADHTDHNERPVTTVFWHYLDYVIQPRFEDLHACIVSLRKDYAAKTSTPESLAKAFRDCEEATKRGRSFQLYWDQYAGNHNSVALWGNFKTCLETYTYYLDWHVRLQSQVWNSPDYQNGDTPLWYRALIHPLRTYREAQTPQGEKPICWQHTFLDHLKESISEDCGVYPHGPETDCLLYDAPDDNPSCDFGPLPSPDPKFQKCHVVGTGSVGDPAQARGQVLGTSRASRR